MTREEAVKIDREHREYYHGIFPVIYDLLSNDTARSIFLSSNSSAQYRLDNVCSGCSNGYVTKEAFDALANLVYYNILDDGEMQLMYNAEYDTWFYTLTYEFETDAEKECKDFGVNIDTTVIKYLDDWDDVLIFKTYLESLISGNFDQLKTKYINELHPLRERVDQWNNIFKKYSGFTNK